MSEFQALVRVEPQGCPSSTIKQFPDLKFVALGGEPIPWPLIRTWVEPGEFTFCVLEVQCMS